MFEPVASGTAAVSVEYHMFHVRELDAPLNPPPDPVNGLVASRPGFAVIRTGASSGLVTVSVEVRHTEPESVAVDEWEEVLDHSLHTHSGGLHVACLMDAPPDLPSLAASGPGWYRLRVHARGRDIAPDGVAFDPVEHYLLTTWPAGDAQPDTVHRQTDHYGAGRRRSATAMPQQPSRRPRPNPDAPRRAPGQPPTVGPSALSHLEEENLRRYRERRRARPVSEEERLRLTRQRRRSESPGAD